MPTTSKFNWVPCDALTNWNKRNQCDSFAPPQTIIEILHNQDLLANYSSFHFNSNYLKRISLDLFKELLIYVKSRWEHFAYKWISSWVHEGRTPTAAGVHGRFAMNHARKYFWPKNRLYIWGANVFQLMRYAKNNILTMYCRKRNFFSTFSVCAEGKRCEA